ncbi:MAG: hypothetical protein ACRDV1_03400 [Actinomycetes bacterium]
MPFPPYDVTLANLPYFVPPLLAFLVVGVLAVVLRWGFGGERRSLVERRPRVGRSGDYGLLTAIASPGTFVEGELLRRTLDDAGIRATLVPTGDGPRLMVFPDDEAAARRLLAGL